MAKTRTIYYCQACGTESPKWMGKCPGCHEWNTFQEMRVEQLTSTEKKAKSWKQESVPNASKTQPIKIGDITVGETIRMDAGDAELNRVLGGGIVSGSMILVAGQPGIGKSTLLIQVAMLMRKKVLYVSGEESEEQIKMRAARVTGLEDVDCYIHTETNIHKILQQAQNLTPDLIILDSIQTMSSPHLESAPGTVSQIRECASELQRFSKEMNVPVFVVGHITKDGHIAGPKVLEHIVDVVLHFEGDQNHAFRILRTHKNRFGSTDEMGIYEMTGTGLRQVSNPSALFLSQSDDSLSGSGVGVMVEGMRPMLVETQALVSPAVYGTPQRSATGFDLRRLSMHLAVLEKRCGFPLAQNDVFLNIAGGLKIKDPGMDLAIVSAIISSLEDQPIPREYCFCGEVGLSGEIRAVHRIEQRIREADKLGFNRIFIPKYNAKGLQLKNCKIDLVPVAKVNDLYEMIF